MADNWILWVLAALLASALASALTYLTMRVKLVRVETQLSEVSRTSTEKLLLLREAEAKLSETFKALSSDALAHNNNSFMVLARSALERLHEGSANDLEKRQLAIGELLVPLRQSLERVDQQIQAMEQKRQGAYASLSEQVKSLGEAQHSLRSETASLASALRAPTVRGRWGELQLRRVVELAGMIEHCDFVEQQVMSSDEGVKRPDMIVRLPGNRRLVIDAKAPLTALLDSLSATTEGERQEKLHEHLRHLRAHVTSLSRKAYWEQFQPTPEFVVLFLPGEHFYSAAIADDPMLFEAASEQRVLIATPTTLIAMLKAIAFGWRQETMAQNAKAISQLGSELHVRVGKFADTMASLGKHLSKVVESYNQGVHHLESRVLVTTRKFEAMGVASEAHAIDEVRPVEILTRNVLQASLPFEQPDAE